MRAVSGIIGGLTVCAAVAVAQAEIINLSRLQTEGKLRVSASPCDIGDERALCNGDWDDIYRTDARHNPAVITLEFTGDQHISPDRVEDKHWLAPGEKVTYIAHVFNKGDRVVRDAEYRWCFDDKVVDKGRIAALEPRARTTVELSRPWPADTVKTIDPPAGALPVLEPQRQRAVTDHRIRFEIDPEGKVEQSCELNNAVEDYINALSFWIFMFDIIHIDGRTLVDSTRRGMMADTARRYLSPGSAAGLERILGLRRGFYGDYLAAIPRGDIAIQVRHQEGAPVSDCQIRVFQRDWSGKVPDTPKFTGATDAEGIWVFTRKTEPGWNGGLAVDNPWSWSDGDRFRKSPDAVGRNAVLVVELSFDDQVEYHFVEVDTCNLAVAEGQSENRTLPLTTYASRAGNRLPVIDFGGLSEIVELSEGDLVETTISATDPDGDPVELRA